MRLNHLNEPVFTISELMNEIYRGNLDKIGSAKVNADDSEYERYSKFLEENNLEDWPLPDPYVEDVRTQKEYDSLCQSQWFISEDYKNFDIEEYLLSLCVTDKEKERVEHELTLYKEMNMLPVLRLLKYLVDQFRANNILWGVGRGSSVSSYCLYLLGVHKIDSIKYNLNINEFLR